MTLSLRSRPVNLVAAAALFAITGAGALSVSTTAHATPISRVRIDQVGYLPSDAKHAYLMASGAVGHASWEIVDRSGKVVGHGRVATTNRGPWNANYPDVYDITFSKLTKLGTYRLRVRGDVTTQSPSFEVEPASALYGRLVKDGVNFFQVQRDGANVVEGDLTRQPAHLADAHATVYDHPLFVDASQSDSTLPGVDLKKVSTGPKKVDASGGWYDAADFLKFTHTNAYGDVLLYASQRALGSDAPSTLKTEAKFGESFLDRMWSMSTRTLYSQVGIGGNNGDDTHDPTFLGDHDLWRLPQADAADTDPLDRYAATNRPVFRAAAPGQPISPNLVGRVSAAFALAAQVDASTDKARAEYEYAEATSLYAMAATANPPNPLVTADPFGFYPERSWHDDMELGAAEIALASQSLGHNAMPYLSDAAKWAKAYIADDAVTNPDTFNLYDVSALAHTDLVNAIAQAGNPNLAVTRTDLVRDVKRQVQLGVTHSNGDPFRAAGDVNQFDVDSHTFAWIAIEAWYVGLTGDHSFDAFAAEQRNWLFGANAWGTSFMVGEGTTFPNCPQHQVANLAGNLHGKGDALVVGAVVNGPNNVSNFGGGLGSLQTGMRQCPTNAIDPFVSFNTATSVFVDDVRAWQTDEPALDMSGAAIIAAASQLALH